MKFRIVTFTPLMLMSCFFMILLTNGAQAEHEYDYLSDRLSREHRDAGDVDDWIERGNATVTASPRFEDGVRLTAWASEYDRDDDYEFAIASTVYFFEIPREAQYIEILVRYRGEPREAELEDYEEIAGRVWIRNTDREATLRSYDDDEAEETRYGDTFVLRAKRRSEAIKVAAAGHVNDGLLEIHIVAENGDELDVESIDVSTYRRQPDIRVIHRYARDYQWRPWYYYTYSYFYEGPFYYCTDLNYYIRWSYPVYDHHYLSIRYAYRDYLHRYYYPHYPYRSYSNTNVNVNVHVDAPVETRQRLNQWTESHEAVRSEYTRSRLAKTVGNTETVGTPNRVEVQTRVRAVIEKHRQEPVLADRVIQSPTVSPKRKRIDAETESNMIIERRSQYLRSSRNSSVPSNDASQLLEKRKRYSSDSPSQKGTNDYTPSNAERRARLYNRSQPSTTTPSAPSSSRQTSPSTSVTKQRRPVESPPRSTSQSETSTTRQTRSSTTSSSNKDDDGDDEKKRQSERSRNTERTKHRRK